MAHLWIRQETDGGWSALDLASGAVDIGDYPPRLLPEDARPGPERQAIVLCLQRKGTPLWVLVVGVGGGVRVNGLEPVAGLRVLRDRDELRAFGRSLFFSTETAAVAAPFIAAERPIFCGRCRQRMEEGQSAVKCPHCGIWYHQTDKLPCWTYSATCGFCPQKATLDMGYAWVPEA